MPTTYSFALEHEVGIIDDWEQNGCLETFDAEKFHHSQAIGICSDGNRLHMLAWALEAFDANAHCCHGTPRIFRYESHGIAMRFGMENPLTVGDIAWLYHLPQFKQAQQFSDGQLKQFNLWHHWPCGAARDAGINLEQSVAWVLLSKGRIKSTHLFPTVSALLWVDIHEGCHKIYRMKLERFVQYFKAHSPELYQLLQSQHHYLMHRGHVTR